MLNKLSKKNNINKFLISLSVILLMLLVIIISVAFLINKGIRLDESQSLWQTSHSLPKLFQIIAQDVHIPLYHTLLHVWQAFLGNDVSAARLLSLIFFVLTVPVVYLLAQTAYNNKTVSLFATLLVAISPFLNWYANEVRMYSLLTFLVVVNQYFFLRIYKRNDSFAYWGYLLSSCFGIYTHYFFAIYLFLQVVFFFLTRKKFAKKTLRKLFAIWIFVGIIFLPWLLFVFLQGHTSNMQPILSIPSSVDFFNTIDQYFLGFQEDSINTIIISMWPLVVILILLLLKRKFKGYRFETTFFGYVAFAPIIFIFFVSVLIHPIFVSRYLCYCIPSLYILVSFVISQYEKALANLMRIVIVALMFIGFVLQLNSADSPVEENYKDALIYINANIKEQDAFIVSAPFTIYPVEYYYRGNPPVNTLPIWDSSQPGNIPAFNKDILPQDVNTLTDDHYKVWLLLSYDQGYEKDIKDYFDQHFKRLYFQTFSKDLSLQVYQISYKH